MKKQSIIKNIGITAGIFDFSFDRWLYLRCDFRNFGNAGCKLCVYITLFSMGFHYNVQFNLSDHHGDHCDPDRNFDNQVESNTFRLHSV